MIKVYGKKGQVLMVVASVEKAVEGLRKGTYKVGAYRIVDESAGKEYGFAKYICYRKQEPSYYFDGLWEEDID